QAGPLRRHSAGFSQRLNGKEPGNATSRQIIFAGVGTSSEKRTFKLPDSDLLPPRSRYPTKWARIRQPSPPPVAYSGPHFCPQHPRLRTATGGGRGSGKG